LNDDKLLDVGKGWVTESPDWHSKLHSSIPICFSKVKTLVI